MPPKNICPYPGLRPFTEEESIFFKGRDVHIKQIIAQLETKKFVMLTGASGDGKSSLVYAGVIPDARAGFFKAKYNNWIITDFTPERSPLENLAATLSQQLELNISDVQKELTYGFSAIIDLYKSTPYYLDYDGDEWKNADEETQIKHKQKASNLFILVDQFEELFTNNINYNRGKPSRRSQTVVNLLLETAKMALEQDLPIYIIFTMRSDYIGHCTAFRGLPEYIGFSQFFVPRLKRQELYQVISEPAVLSGSVLTHKLVEILVNELSEGFDQLPVLQHALNTLWNNAVGDLTEIDLIHLAKLSGIPATYLPEEDKAEFDKWFDNLPVSKRKYFDNHSLNSVLGMHANELYETAHEYYDKNSGSSSRPLTSEDTRFIIKTAFQSLTKIDEGKAVRNRITLKDITDILNQPHIDAQVVGLTLNVFREQGNTFIRPYITSDSDSVELLPDTVLDITHEALIRNWDLLKQWADEEYENWADFLDFRKQLDRWLESNQSRDYLLPIGPLSYFEKWFIKCNPNQHWLKKYNEGDIDESDKVRDAVKFIENAGLFIKVSKKANRRKRNIAIAVAIGLIVVLSGFTSWALFERSIAIDQTEVAEFQSKEAREAEEKARNEQHLAIKAKVQAKKNAKQAFSAKQEAEELREEAEGERQKAEVSRLVAVNAKTIVEKELYANMKNSLTVSADRINLLYKGIPNPVTISVSGIKSENLIPIVIGYNATIKGSNGNYIIRPDAYIPPDTNVVIQIYGVTNKGDTIDCGIKEFKPIFMPSAKAMINGKVGDKITLFDLMVAKKLDVYIPEGVDLNAKIVSFTLKTKIGTEAFSYKSNSNKFTKEQRSLVDKINPEEMNDLTIHEIQTIEPDGYSTVLYNVFIKGNIEDKIGIIENKGGGNIDRIRSTFGR